MISIDSTYLYDYYKGRMLVTVGLDANVSCFRLQLSLSKVRTRQLGSVHGLEGDTTTRFVGDIGWT